jgi:SWI/SNF-related matrix-associated actin-dependent regulator of chromatin subfamily A-like protein 1
MSQNSNNKTASMVKNQYGERMIKMSFPYDIEVLDKVRSLIGRKYHSDKKIWTAPLYHETVNQLIEWGFTPDEKLTKFISRTKLKTEQVKLSGLKIPGLRGTPRNFQYEAVSFVELNNGRALIADEMGLGKTVETLSWLQLHRDRVPILIVCPASLKLNWEIEYMAWLPNPSIEILSGEVPWQPTADVLIINYDILPKWVKVLRRLGIQIMITDECQYYKNDKAKRTEAVKFLARSIPYFLALSGTPIENRPVEMINAIFIIKPDLFTSPWHFKHEFCGAKHNGYGWDFNGASNVLKLHKILTDTIMIRRLKKDVLKELPEKQYSFIPMQLDNQKEYDEAKNNFISFIRENQGAKAALKAKKAEVLVQLGTLKQLAVKGALKQSIGWIQDFVDTDNKLVIFATHKFVIDALMEVFRSIAVKVDGSVSIKDRQTAVDKFQFDTSCKLFIGNIDAAGVGLTLTAASSVAFLELPWGPGKLKQAIDRVHRIGQKLCVNVYYLFAINTIMQRTAKLIDVKQRTIDAVLDGIETEDADLIYELMKEFE